MNEIDIFVKECMKREHDETFHEWKKQVLINSIQPERLSPEDKFDYKKSPAYLLQEKVMKEFVSDSLNNANK